MRKVNLSAWAIGNPAIVLYLLLAVLVSGAYSYFLLPQKEDPNFTFKVLTIRLLWPGASATEVEQQITGRIEHTLEETPWLDSVISYSKAGEAGMYVILKDAMPASELERTWGTVRKRLAEVKGALPEGVEGPMVDDESGVTFGAIYAFTSDTLSLSEIERAARLAQREIMRLEHVQKAELVGAQPEKIFIEFSSNRFAALGIDPMKVAALVGARNVVEPAGYLVTGTDRTQLRLENQYRSIEDIENVGILARGTAHRLGDIAHIYRGYEDPARFKMKYNGRHAIGLAIAADPHADVITVGRAFQQVMERIGKDLPAGLEIHQVSDQAKVVKQSIDQFMQSLFEALLIVLGVGFYSLGGRAGLVVALSIPLVMAGTFLMMNVFGVDLHRVSIGALIIAIGLLVDDAMIAVEMMKVKLQQGHAKGYAMTFAYESTAWPMLTGTLVTAAAFLPVGLAKSAAGEYTFSICAVVTIALLVSWLVAVIFTPFIGYHVLHEQRAQGEEMYQSHWYRWLRDRVVGALRHRKAVIVATVALFCLAIGGFLKVDQQFFPSSERAELLVDIWLPEGTRFAATETLAGEVARKLKDDEDIVQYTSYIGGTAPRFYLPLDLQLPTVNYAQIVISTRGTEARERVLQRLRKILDEDFAQFGIRISRLENGPPVGYPIQFRVVGDDPASIRGIAEQVLAVVKADNNTKNVSQDSNEPIKTLRIAVDQEKARKADVPPESVSRYLRMFLSGITVSRFREGANQHDIVMRATDIERDSLDFLDRAAVQTASGKIVPLVDIASIDEGSEDGIIWHIKGQPVVTVRADVHDNVQAPEVGYAIDNKLAAIRANLPKGYRIELGGVMEGNDQATDSILAVLPLMSFLILSLLMFQLRRFRLVALVLLTAPLGIIGVTGALLAFNVPFGFVALLGMISLAGMIMRNSIILVDQIEQDMAQGLSRYDAIIESTVRRARPILLTAAAAIFAMLPLATNGFWAAMAIVIMGGLFIATLLTLFFLPALYAAWYRVSP